MLVEYYDYYSLFVPKELLLIAERPWCRIWLFRCGKQVSGAFLYFSILRHFGDQGLRLETTTTNRQKCNDKMQLIR